MGKKDKGRNETPVGMSKGDHYDALAPLQSQLNDLARWLVHTGKRLVVVEGPTPPARAAPSTPLPRP